MGEVRVSIHHHEWFLLASEGLTTGREIKGCCFCQLLYTVEKYLGNWYLRLGLFRKADTDGIANPFR